MLALLANASTATIRSSSIPSARLSRGRTRRRKQRGCAGGTRAPHVGIRGGGRSNVTKMATTAAAVREGSGGQGGKGASRGSYRGGRSRREGRTGEASRMPLRIRSGGLPPPTASAGRCGSAASRTRCGGNPTRLRARRGGVDDLKADGNRPPYPRDDVEVPHDTAQGHPRRAQRRRGAHRHGGGWKGNRGEDREGRCR
ncbi:hypothetical protein PVAP13_6KG067700 [Panicum virgatum]|uniref:Uncharacterized protein n=1 Tax=Panicum virgatum TaxID=38727 RepID=A0A8T0R8Y8_PANVG|nr:hypothetical protein PVAP13_6KG067700 [Panicum virgatum]